MKDTPDLTLRNTIRFGNVALFSSISTDRPHGFICKFGASMFFATLGCPMVYLVSYVFLMCPPIQVVQSVITGLPIFMTRFFSCAWPSYKSEKDKALYPVSSYFSIFRELNTLISSFFYMGFHGSPAQKATSSPWFNNPTWKRLNASKRGYLIETFVGRNVFPDFFGWHNASPVDALEWDAAVWPGTRRSGATLAAQGV